MSGNTVRKTKWLEFLQGKYDPSKKQQSLIRCTSHVPAREEKRRKRKAAAKSQEQHWSGNIVWKSCTLKGKETECKLSGCHVASQKGSKA